MELLFNKLVPHMGNYDRHYSRGKQEEEVVRQNAYIILLACNVIKQEIHPDDDEAIYSGVEHPPWQKEINSDDDKIQACIVAGVKATQVNGHQNDHPANNDGYQIAVNVREFARVGPANDGVLNNGYDCAGESVYSKSLQEVFWHGEVVEDKKERNQDENQGCYGF